MYEIFNSDECSNCERIGLQFVLCEAFGLIFRKVWTRWRQSDFPNTDYVFETASNIKYNNMFDKPVLRIHHYPNGRIDIDIYNLRHMAFSAREQDITVLTSKELNFSKLYFDGKSIYAQIMMRLIRISDQLIILCTLYFTKILSSSQNWIIFLIISSDITPKPSWQN